MHKNLSCNFARYTGSNAEGEPEVYLKDIAQGIA